LDDTGSNSVKEQDDKMATDSQNEAEPNNLEEQKDNEATPMEQVSFYLKYCSRTNFSKSLCLLRFLFSFLLVQFSAQSCS
jgi:U2 small nuclear ribonucleoprotein A'